MGSSFSGEEHAPNGPISFVFVDSSYAAIRMSFDLLSLSLYRGMAGGEVYPG